jgi:ribosome recycling factor
MTEPNAALEKLQKEMKDQMEKAVTAFRHDLQRIRTGRASLALLEPVRVDYYGNPTPLNQVATLGVPDPKLITITPWDPKLIQDIEKAIFKSELGLNPANDGKVIRIAIPDLTEERRKELVRVVKKTAEEFRVEVRNHRRDAIHRVKEMEKKSEVTEDEDRKAQEKIQKVTNEYITKIDQLVEAKEKEILQV